MYLSMASALFYAGFGEAAAHINRVAIKDGGRNSRVLIHKLKWKFMQMNKMALRFHNVKDEFNWKEDLKEKMFYLGAIHGSDGNAQHALTLYRNWIFDSNDKIAIPLGKEGLDFCTQTEEERELTGSTSVFSHFQQGIVVLDGRTNGEGTKVVTNTK